ncbi:hypothetical protein HK104_009841 [Borealophlyctis nickersoniae]|nr:hypothetical protein HK104_009841 [Borealophlyctis nickersoniae]
MWPYIHLARQAPLGGAARRVALHPVRSISTAAVLRFPPKPSELPLPSTPQEVEAELIDFNIKRKKELEELASQPVDPLIHRPPPSNDPEQIPAKGAQNIGFKPSFRPKDGGSEGNLGGGKTSS